MKKLWSLLLNFVCLVYCAPNILGIVHCAKTEHPEHPELYQRNHHDLPADTGPGEPAHATWSCVATGPWCTQFHSLESDSEGLQTSLMICYVRYIGFKGLVIYCATFQLIVNKSIFMWLIHTCQLSWNTELTCFIQDILDLEVLTWNICLPQPAFIHKMSVLQINIAFGEVFDPVDVYLSTFSINIGLHVLQIFHLSIRKLNSNQPNIFLKTAPSINVIWGPINGILYFNSHWQLPIDSCWTITIAFQLMCCMSIDMVCKISSCQLKAATRSLSNTRPLILLLLNSWPSPWSSDSCPICLICNSCFSCCICSSCDSFIIRESCKRCDSFIICESCDSCVICLIYGTCILVTAA